MPSPPQRVGVALAGALLAGSTVAAPASAEAAALTRTVVCTPVPACVNVCDTGYGWVDQACTDDTGTWTATATEAGTSYKAEIQPTD